MSNVGLSKLGLVNCTKRFRIFASEIRGEGSEISPTAQNEIIPWEERVENTAMLNSRGVLKVGQCCCTSQGVAVPHEERPWHRGGVIVDRSMYT